MTSDTRGMANMFGSDLGEFIREQRRIAQISVRGLAKAAGVSNPYLSQIERGLRRPSAEILQQIAKGLRISAEALYVQAGILDERIAGGVVVDAVLADATLSERQKQVMLEIYDSFRNENERRDAEEALRAEAAKLDSVDLGRDLDEDWIDDGLVEIYAPPEPPAPAVKPMATRTTLSRVSPKKPR
jgi:transcriptional regulator with XRE-family HTH domain